MGGRRTSKDRQSNVVYRLISGVSGLWLLPSYICPSTLFPRIFCCVVEDTFRLRLYPNFTILLDVHMIVRGVHADFVFGDFDAAVMLSDGPA